MLADAAEPPVADAGTAVAGWQQKLLVLCEVARELVALGRLEPATSIAFRILELDGLLPPAQPQPQPPLPP